MGIRPLFISVDGPDGCGKTTAIPVILDELKKHNINAIASREPGGSPSGELIRNILKSEECRPSPVAQLLLLLAGRDEHLTKTVIPAMASGTTVVSDRYKDSTDVYQGKALGLSATITYITGAKALSRLRVNPDYTLYFSITPSTLEERLKSRPNDYLDTMWQGHNPATLYEQHFQYVAAKTDRRIFRIDANGDIASVNAQIEKTIAEIVRNERTIGFFGEVMTE